jgi:hypothetical protein
MLVIENAAGFIYPAAFESLRLRFTPWRDGKKPTQ